MYVELKDLADGEEKFRFKAAVYLKKFKNQKSVTQCGNISVSGNSADEVMIKIWNNCVKYMNRAVFFSVSDAEEEATWDEELPSYENRNNFLVFQDKSSKRNTVPSKVDGSTLQSWLTKDISLFVYRYSDTVSNVLIS